MNDLKNVKALPREATTSMAGICDAAISGESKYRQGNKSSTDVINQKFWRKNEIFEEFKKRYFDLDTQSFTFSKRKGLAPTYFLRRGFRPMNNYYFFVY